MPRRLHRSCSRRLDSRRPPQRPKPLPPPPCTINTSSSSRLATARGTKFGRALAGRLALPLVGTAAATAALAFLAVRLGALLLCCGDFSPFFGLGFPFLADGFGVLVAMATIG